MTDWITTEEAAALIGVSVKTLGRWRTNLDPKTGKPVHGPVFRKNPGACNAHVKYRRSVVEAWIRSQEVSPD